MRIQLIGQFGVPVRGVSPYADGLLSGLRQVGGLQVETVDFRAAYPGVLHPAQHSGSGDAGGLSWFNPFTWRAVANASDGLMHVQHWAPPLATYLWPLVRLAKQNGRRVVITVHNPRAHEREGVFSAMERQFFLSADMLLAHGEVGASMLRERLGARHIPIVSIPHGIGVLAGPPEPSIEDFIRLGLDPGHRHILLFGNLRGYKGVDLLLDAWRVARQELPGAKLVIAGRLWDGGKRFVGRASARLLGSAADANRLRAVLADAEVMRDVVLRQGFQDEADIDALIRVCELAVFPYVRFSGQSGAASRAAGFGCPLLVSRVGALPDLAIDESWVFEPGDSIALAALLVEKLRSRVAMKAASHRQINRVSRFGWDVVARAHVDAYRAVA